MKANPATVTAMAAVPERCYFGDYPTLSETAAVYGRKTAVQWLSAQLTAASAFCGARNMTAGQIDTLAQMIHSEYCWLRITEVMLFLYKWMTGKYGEQYGSVDPQSIMRALATFVNNDRATAYDIRERERQRTLNEQYARNAVPMPDYVKQTINRVRK